MWHSQSLELLEMEPVPSCLHPNKNSDLSDKTCFHLSPQDGGFIWVPAPLCHLPALQPRLTYLQL